MIVDKFISIRGIAPTYVQNILLRKITDVVNVSEILRLFR